jgi:hypothetical protein
VHIRTYYALGVWNPARPLGRDNAVADVPGSARYRLADDGRVLLEHVSSDGEVKDYVGALVDAPNGHGAGKHLSRFALVFPIVGVCGGFMGYLCAASSFKAPGTAVGVIIGLSTFDVVVFVFGRSVRRKT